MTIGRTERTAGQIGVKMKASMRGWMIGPPAESEWPVEPVGVASITPSDLNEIIFLWSISARREIKRAKLP